jgi:hypothetical protein
MKRWTMQQGRILMRSPIPRRFTLVDAMVLIAATAIAMVLMRPLLEEMRPLGVHSLGDALRLGSTVSVTLEPMALTLSLAVGLLRLREPRPRLRRAFRQPGMVACMAVLSCIFINIFIF